MLCGATVCGCAVTSVPATVGEIDGFLPTIDVAGNGTTISPWNFTLNDDWAAAIADRANVRGEVGYAAIYANDTPTSAGTVQDITGLSVTFDAIAGRRYKVTAQFEIDKSVGTDTSVVALQDLTTSLQRYTDSINTTDLVTGGLSYVTTASISGAKTWRLTVQRAFGTGTITVGAAAIYPAFILVEDIGVL